MTSAPELGDAATASPPPAETCVQVGLVVSPALTKAAALELRSSLAQSLRERYPEVDWEFDLVLDRLLPPPAELTELVDAARSRLLAEDWDVALHVTELPLSLSRRPLVRHASPTHAVALVSLPALGVLRRGRRLHDTAVDAVAALIGDSPAGRPLARRALVELGTDVDDDSQPGIFLLTRVVTGNIRLLLGMVGANRPARLVGRLSRAFVGALAAGSFALVTSDVWRLAHSLDTLRLGALTVTTVALAVVTLITAHDLWERASSPQVREQVMLFNVATTATLSLGIVTLYATILALALGVAALLVDDSLLAEAVGEPAGLWDYLRLAWLTASLATVGGALGSALESDVAVREAAYAYQPVDERNLDR
jgi:uncharacterized membrane protein